MGFSPGEFKDELREQEIHWEGGPGKIQLWSFAERDELVRLSIPEARKAVNQLLLLVEMAEADGL